MIRLWIYINFLALGKQKLDMFNSFHKTLIITHSVCFNILKSNQPELVFFRMRNGEDFRQERLAEGVATLRVSWHRFLPPVTHNKLTASLVFSYLLVVVTDTISSTHKNVVLCSLNYIS
jgi:hypothetical protein